MREAELDSIERPIDSDAMPRLEGEAAAADDGALVAAVLRKDRKATAEFVSRHADSVYGYVRSRLAPRMDLAEDLVQEVFLAAWEHLPSFRADSRLEAWLMGIARHKVEDHYRARLREPDPLEDDSPTELSATTVFPEFETALDAERMERKTVRALGALPEIYRLALLWRYWEKCPAREMAARTGKSEKAIERMLARAREQFRQRWLDE
jgi:RNA polymerase sigma-70 factor (ECF subfamily)